MRVGQKVAHSSSVLKPLDGFKNGETNSQIRLSAQVYHLKILS